MIVCRCANQDTCLWCLIKKTVQEEYGTVGLGYLQKLERLAKKTQEYWHLQEFLSYNDLVESGVISYEKHRKLVKQRNKVAKEIEEALDGLVGEELTVVQTPVAERLASQLASVQRALCSIEGVLSTEDPDLVTAAVYADELTARARELFSAIMRTLMRTGGSANAENRELPEVHTQPE